MKKELATLFIIGILLISACNRKGPESTTPAEAPQTNSPMPSPLAVITATSTSEEPTRTPAPTQTTTSIPPTATTTPDILPKLVLVSQGISGGDGAGPILRDYIIQAISLPDYILYEDGQLLIREGDWYLEATLSAGQACSFVRSITQAIRSAETAVRHNGSPTPEYGFGSGEPAVYIKSIEEDPVQLYYSIYERDLLTTAFLQPYALVETLANRYPTEPYQGDQLVLWIQSFTLAGSTGIDDIEHFSNWTHYDKPNLERIVTESSSPILILSGEDAAALRKELGHEPAITLFETRAEMIRKYVILSRPLLPHETAPDFLYAGYSGYYGYGDLASVCGE